MKHLSVVPLALMLVVSGIQARSISQLEHDSLAEGASHSLLAEHHALAKRSLDFFWNAFKGLGSSGQTNETTGRSADRSNSIETNMKKVFSHVPFKRDVSRSKRSIHELHRLLKEQNDQLQRLLRTLPGGHLLSPVLTPGSQPPPNIFKPMQAITDTLLFVKHERKNDTTEQPPVALAVAPVAPVVASAAEPAIVAVPVTEPVVVAAPVTEAVVVAAPVTEAVIVEAPVTDAAIVVAPAAPSDATTEAVVVASAAASATASASSDAGIEPKSVPVAPESTTVGSTTASASSESTTAGSVEPRVASSPAPEVSTGASSEAASTTAAAEASTADAAPRDGEPSTTAAPVAAESEAPVGSSTEVDGSGSLQEEPVFTDEPAIHTL